MKTALYMGQKSIKMADAPMPACGENDILLKNIYASICGTDVFGVYAWTEYRTQSDSWWRIWS